MNKEERKDYLKYIENYTINDLADIFNTQKFVIQDKDKFNEILLYYHFKQNEEIEQLEKENQSLKKENKILRENAEHNDKVVDKVNWENLKLKKQLEEYKRLGFKHLNDKCNKLENQQKKFIEYMSKTIEELETDDVGDEELKGYLIQEIDIFKEILSKYYEIIEK